MRIVYICNSEIPSTAANSINVMKMCQAFAKNSHEVILVAPNKNNKSNVTDIFQYYGVQDNFTVKKLPWLKLKGKTYFYALNAAFQAKSLQPDIVYSRFITATYLSALFGLKAIYEAHMPAVDFGKTESRLFKRLIRSNNLRRLVVISQPLRDYYLSQYSLAENRILVAHDGADPMMEDLLQPPVTANSELQVGYLGQLYPGKGLELIIELARRCNRAKFHVIGGRQDDIDHWQNLVNDLDNIEFHGHLPHSQTQRALLQFDVVLAPYQRKVSTYSGGNIAQWMSPLKIFEYMAAGRAIVCSDLPVLTEVLTDQKNALLCAPDDIQQWVTALKKLNEDKVLREKLGTTAQQDFLQHYTWQARAEKILDLSWMRGLG